MAASVEVEEYDRPVLNLLTKKRGRQTRDHVRVRRARPGKGAPSKPREAIAKRCSYERPVQLFPLLEASRDDFTMLRGADSPLDVLHLVLFVPLFYLMFPLRLAVSLAILPFVLLSGVKVRSPITPNQASKRGRRNK